MEADLPTKYIDNGRFTLILEAPAASWTTASTIAKIINDAEGTRARRWRSRSIRRTWSSRSRTIERDAPGQLHQPRAAAAGADPADRGARADQRQGPAR